MIQVIDSSKWTGVTDDPSLARSANDRFIALSTGEREGLLEFRETTSRLYFALAIMGLIAAGGIFVFLQSLRGDPIRPGRSASRTLESMGLDHTTGGFIVGAVIVAGMVLIGSFVYRRIANAKLTAPLIISDYDLLVGKEARKISLREITAVRFHEPSYFGVPQPFPLIDVKRRLPILEVVSDKGDRLLLDLALLDGNAATIATILQYRVLKARGEIDG